MLMANIAVYAFAHVDDSLNAEIHSPRKATREAIERIRGRLIEASKEEVEESEVDRNGFYPCTADESK
jgi:hypothetical protein